MYQIEESYIQLENHNHLLPPSFNELYQHILSDAKDFIHSASESISPDLKPINPEQYMKEVANVQKELNLNPEETATLMANVISTSSGENILTWINKLDEIPNYIPNINMHFFDVALAKRFEEQHEQMRRFLFSYQKKIKEVTEMFESLKNSHMDVTLKTLFNIGLNKFASSVDYMDFRPMFPEIKNYAENDAQNHHDYIWFVSPEFKLEQTEKKMEELDSLASRNPFEAVNEIRNFINSRNGDYLEDTELFDKYFLSDSMLKHPSLLAVLHYAYPLIYDSFCQSLISPSQEMMEVHQENQDWFKEYGNTLLELGMSFEEYLKFDTALNEG